MKNKTFIIWIIVILSIFAVLLAVTTKKPKRSDYKSVTSSLAQPFDAKATIKMKDLVMVADINKSSPGKATVVINSPKSLEGMNFQYDGNDIKVGFKGLSVKLDENSKIASTVIGAIVKSIDKASSPSGINVKVEGKVINISGQSESGRFNIKLDKDTHSVVSLTLPELDFECNFDDFIFKK